MSYRTTAAFGAVLVLALVAISIWQMVESRALRQRVVLLEQEISSHQEHLEEPSTRGRSAGVVAAINLIDSTGFHDMELALEDGEYDPRDPATVGRAATVAQAIEWPEQLQETADSFVEAASSLQEALEREDLAAARKAVVTAHDLQHLLSHEAYGFLGAQGATAVSEAGDDTSRSSPTGAGHGSSQQAEQQGAEPETEAVLEIGERGGPVGGAHTFRVNRGEQFQLRIVSESAGVLHLHGYSLEWELESGATRVISVDGDTVGRFPFELHPVDGESGIAVGYLEVRP